MLYPLSYEGSKTDYYAAACIGLLALFATMLTCGTADRTLTLSVNRACLATMSAITIAASAGIAPEIVIAR